MDQVALSAPSTKSITPLAKGNDTSLVSSAPLAHKPLFEYFGLTKTSDYTSPRHNQALAQIWEWAKTVAPNKDKDSVLFEVMRLKSRLGSGGIENNPYLKVEMYVKTWRQMHDADQRMKELEAKPEED